MIPKLSFVVAPRHPQLVTRELSSLALSTAFALVVSRETRDLSVDPSYLDAITDLDGGADHAGNVSGAVGGGGGGHFAGASSFRSSVAEPHGAYRIHAMNDSDCSIAWFRNCLIEALRVDGSGVGVDPRVGLE